MKRAVSDLKNAKELIGIAESLDTGKDYCQLYEFAAKYLQGIKPQRNTETFRNTVKVIMNNPVDKQNLKVLGFSGKGDPMLIKKWCSYIMSCKDLADLDFDDLHYVMGYCARLSKIHKEGC